MSQQKTTIMTMTDIIMVRMKMSTLVHYAQTLERQNVFFQRRQLPRTLAIVVFDKRSKWKRTDQLINPYVHQFTIWIRRLHSQNAFEKEHIFWYKKNLNIFRFKFKRSKLNINSKKRQKKTNQERIKIKMEDIVIQQLLILQNFIEQSQKELLLCRFKS